MSVRQLAEAAGRALSIEVERVEQLEGGEFNLTVLLSTSAGRFVARRPMFRQDWRSSLRGQAAAIDRCRAAGVPVPEVVHVDDDIFVQRFVEGLAMTELEAASGLGRRAGELLSVMHQITGDGVGPVQPDGSCPSWPSLTYFDSVGDEVADLLASLAPDVGISRDDVEVAGALLARPPELRGQLVHGDAGPSNIVVRDGEIAAFIDFDNAWFGDAAIDLAWWWWRSPATAAAFASGGIDAGDDTDAPRMWACRVRLLVGLAHVFAMHMPDRAALIGRLLPIANAALSDAT